MKIGRSRAGAEMALSIVLLVAAIPIVLFLRTVFLGRRRTVVKGAMSDLSRHIDYLVWAILFVIGCGIVYSIVKIIAEM